MTATDNVIMRLQLPLLLSILREYFTAVLLLSHQVVPKNVGHQNTSDVSNLMRIITTIGRLRQPHI